MAFQRPSSYREHNYTHCKLCRHLIICFDEGDVCIQPILHLLKKHPFDIPQPKTDEDLKEFKEIISQIHQLLKENPDLIVNPNTGTCYMASCVLENTNVSESP